MDWKLELVAIPVSDVDRAKAFYTEQVGFNADHDHEVNDELRFVQLTPPGSGCSIAIGTGVTDAAPGSVQGMQLVVPDIEAAHEQLSAAGVGIDAIQDLPWARSCSSRTPTATLGAFSRAPAGTSDALDGRLRGLAGAGSATRVAWVARRALGLGPASSIDEGWVVLTRVRALPPWGVRAAVTDRGRAQPAPSWLHACHADVTDQGARPVAPS